MTKFFEADVETEPIHSRPDYPPKAVGLALRYDRRSEYLAFGHPEGNNCSAREAMGKFRSLVREGRKPVFHGSDFDAEVLSVRHGVSVPTSEMHDTLRLAFLNNPYSRSLDLKSQAEDYCDVEPEERDLLKAWILEHVPEAKRNKKKWGEYICKAPGDVVAPYAKGDVDRTKLLRVKFGQDVFDRGMEEAYRREMDLIPIKLDMEQRGIRVRLRKLKKDAKHYDQMHEALGARIRRRLRCSDLNIGSSKQLAEVLVRRNLLHPVVRTPPSKNYPDGQISTKREILQENCTDKHLQRMLAVYGVLSTYRSTFIQRWIDIAEINDGYVQPRFNTTRGADEFGGKGFGTRTGRFSSSDPNFQNIPNSVEESQNAATLMLLRDWMRKETGFEFLGLRDYFAPDEGCVFIGRDYDQQELRILAHFSEGDFLSMYLEDPTMDGHELVRQLVYEAIGIMYHRKHVKITNFGIIYGMGLLKLAKRLGIDVADAKILKRAILKAVPGIKKQNRLLREMAEHGEPFYTWGGREYYCEEPKEVKTPRGKEFRTFEYKMLNTLIQGSAADCTKQGMINTYQNFDDARIVLQVHDELLCCAPIGREKRAMRQMREGMEDVKFKLPMLSDGMMSRVSWARMRKVGRDYA